MNVLMWLSRGTEVPGGHRIQLSQTAAALRDLGVDVHEHLGTDLPAGSWDVVHGFQLNPAEVLAARRRGMPVVLSTIYWGLAYTTTGVEGSRTPRGVLGGGRRGLRYLAASFRGREDLTRLAIREMHVELDQMRAWSMADLLLPNAEGEARHIRDDLGVLTDSRVIPNAIEADLFTPHFDQSRESGTVLCVGRIEPHKNQLGVIEALRGVPGIHLTVVGPPHPHHLDYYERCRKAATRNVTMLGGVDHELLPSLYAQHRTHVLASWYETTGLVSLEAAAAGCTVVTTDRGHAREYLGQEAWYCDPAERGSIADAVSAAAVAPPSRELLARIRERYTWAHTAQHTLAAYSSVVPGIPT